MEALAARAASTVADSFRKFSWSGPVSSLLTRSGSVRGNTTAENSTLGSTYRSQGEEAQKNACLRDLTIDTYAQTYLETGFKNLVLEINYRKYSLIKTFTGNSNKPALVHDSNCTDFGDFF